MLDRARTKPSPVRKPGTGVGAGGRGAAAEPSDTDNTGDIIALLHDHDIGDSGMCVWNLGSFTCGNWWQGAVYQTLVTINVTAQQKEGVIQVLPDLATAWTLSPDGKTYTFTTRQDVTFSNGDPFNAYVVWTDFYMQYYMYGNAPNFVFGLPLFNFDAVNFGPATLSLVKESGLSSPSQNLLSIMEDNNWPVFVKDQNTIVFQLAVPFTGFLTTLVSPYILEMYDPVYIMENGGPGAPGTPNSYFIGHMPPGTGPYVVESVIESSRMVFVKNDDYWGRSLTPAEVAANPILDPGHFETIVVKYIPDNSVRYLDLMKGEAHLAPITGSNFQLILQSKSPDYKWVTWGAYSATVVFMSMHTQRYPTSIRDVRLAIVHAINVTEIIDRALFGQGIPYVGPESPNYGEYYNPGNLSPYEYDVAAAKEHLARAGFPDGKDFPALTLNIDSLSAWEMTAAQLVQKDLAAIGITVNIVVTTFPTFISTYMQGYDMNLHNPQVADMAFNSGNAYSPDYIGVTNYLAQFTTNMSTFGNFAVYNSDATYRALNLFTSSNDKAALREAMIAAYQQIYDDAPYDWFFVCKLPQVDGSIVYNTKVVTSLWNEPQLYGGEDLPLLNTIAD
jgi:peptide/nickel transport system substrate-binding protein